MDRGSVSMMTPEKGDEFRAGRRQVDRRYAEEAQRAGLLNRVVDADRLDAEVEALVARLEAMPEVPVAMTKEHVNGVARQASAAVLGFAEGDRLVAAALDPEAIDGAERASEKSANRSAPGLLSCSCDPPSRG